DLKPANLFVTTKGVERPTVKLLDFGLAKNSLEPDGAITTSQVVFGTPQYMSPEQLRSLTHVDARTDVWALGAILWELLVGRPAFDARARAQVAAKVIREAVPKPKASRKDIPQKLEDVILRALEKDLSRRFLTVKEFARALLPFAPGGYESVVMHIPRSEDS